MPITPNTWHRVNLKFTQGSYVYTPTDDEKHDFPSVESLKVSKKYRFFIDFKQSIKQSNCTLLFRAR